MFRHLFVLLWIVSGDITKTVGKRNREKVSQIKMLVRNRLLDAQFEVRQLERLLEEARIRERNILRDLGRQNWGNWLWEWVFGY